MQGQTGSHFEPRAVPPPLPNKCDWEVDPSELDFSSSARIGKVASPRVFYSFRLYCHCKLYSRRYRDVNFKTCFLCFRQLFVLLMLMFLGVDMGYSVRFIMLCIET